MIAFILIVIALFCFSYYKAKQKKADQEMDRIMNAPSETVSAEVLPLNKNDMEENQNISTRNLCAEVLRKLNCEVQFDEENEYTMFFTYQGENFRIDTWKDCLMIGIWDVWWGTVDLDDMPYPQSNQYDKYQFFLDNGLFNRPRRSTFCCSYQASMLVSSADTKH